MGSDIYGNNAILAERSVGRNPEWFKQNHTVAYAGVSPDRRGDTGLPGSGSGVSLGGAVVLHYRLDLRRDIEQRTALVEFASSEAASLGTDFRLDLDGTNVDYDAPTEAPADLEELVTAYAAAVVTAAITGVTATAVRVESGAVVSGVANALQVKSTDGHDFYIAPSITSGTGTLTVTADALSAKAKFYKRDAGTGASRNLTRWAKIPSEGTVDVDQENIGELLGCAGVSDMYIRLFDIAPHDSDGAGVLLHAEVRIGPAILESDAP